MLFPTTYFPAATSPSAATLVRAVSGRERTGIDMAVRLARTFQVSGSLTLPDGSAAANYAVHLLPGNSAPTPVADVATAVTDSGGTFTFFGVPSGSYVARVIRMPKSPGAEFGQCGGTGAVTFVCVLDRPNPSGAAPAATARDDGLAYVEAPVVVSDADVRALSLVLRDGAHVIGRIELVGETPRPASADIQRIAVLLEPADGRSFSAAGGYDATRSAIVGDTGEFSTPGTWPGRYLVRASGLPRGWMFGTAVHGGRDVSDSPMDLTGDVSDVVIRLVDKAPRLSGAIQTASVRALRGTTVVLFPTDPAGWEDYGRSSRRVAAAPAVNGRYTFTGTPPGDYFLVALADEDLGGWQNPDVLKRLSTIADRVTVNAGDVSGPALRVQTLP
jgi:hypothetical protein